MLVLMWTQAAAQLAFGELDGTVKSATGEDLAVRLAAEHLTNVD